MDKHLNITPAAVIGKKRVFPLHAVTSSLILLRVHKLKKYIIFPLVLS